MKLRKLTSFAAAVAALISLASCDKSDVLAYSQTIICSVVDGRLYSDQNEYLNIVKNHTTSPTPLQGIKRAVIYCDILNHTEGKTGEYDINLIDLAPVTIADIARKSSSDDRVLGSDAASIHSAWFSKDYLNIDATYTAFTNSKTEHYLTILLDDVKSNSDTLYLSLRHNARGESYDSPGAGNNIQVVGEYFSYPVSQVIPAGTESIVVSFTWDWFKLVDNYLVKDRETTTACMTWKKEDY